MLKILAYILGYCPQAYRLSGNIQKYMPKFLTIFLDITIFFYTYYMIISQLFGFMYYGKLTIFLDIVPIWHIFLANWQYFWILCRFFGKYFWILCRFSAYIFEYCADFSAYIFEYMPISLIKILNKDRLKNIFFFEYQRKYGVFFIHKCTKFYLRATI